MTCSECGTKYSPYYCTRCEIDLCGVCAPDHNAGMMHQPCDRKKFIHDVVWKEDKDIKCRRCGAFVPYGETHCDMCRKEDEQPEPEYKDGFDIEYRGWTG